MKKINKMIIPIAVIGILLTYSPVDAVKGDTLTKNKISTDFISEKESNKNGYKSFKGEIISTEKISKDNYQILVKGDKDLVDDIIFNINKSTILFSDETENAFNIDELKEGINITGYYNHRTPVTMSIPPQLTPEILILNKSKSLTKVDIFNENLVDFDNSLELNVGENTKIVDKNNNITEKKSFEKSNKLLVFYKATTKSIPAKTTPSKIVLIEAGKSEKSGNIFTDVEEGHWAKDSIESLSNKGLVQGYRDGTFKPSKSITKGDFISTLSYIMERVETNPEQQNEGTLLLLDESENWLYEHFNKVIKHLDSGTISKLKFQGAKDLNESITRKEAAYLINNVIKFSNEPKEISFKDVVSKTDASMDFASYSKDILNVAGQDIFKGFKDNTFRPDEVLTRAEAATVLNRLIN